MPGENGKRQSETEQTDEDSGELESGKSKTAPLDDSPKSNQSSVEQRQILADLHWLIHQGHVKDETNKGIVCNYKKFSILIKSNNGTAL